MVPKRKISKHFRERKVPNIQFDVNCKVIGDLENMAPHLPQTSNIITLHRIRETARKDQNYKSGNPNQKTQKNNLINIINIDTLKHIDRKMQLEQKNDCFLTNGKQLCQPDKELLSKNRTMQSEDNSIEKFVERRADKFSSSNKKTDLADKILQSIQASINSTCRSMSAMSKDKAKRKRIIDQCKVAKVPWKSSKREFKPEVSMIRKNSSRAPMDSLREIYQNLN